jgi:predicted Zn-dependent protease with MMP-like domain
MMMTEAMTRHRLATTAGLVTAYLAGTAVLAAACFEVVAGAGSAWGRVPAGLVVVAFAGATGWLLTRDDEPAAATTPAATSAPAKPIEFGGAADPELEALVEQAVDAIPQQFRDQISNLAFVIEDEPPPGKSWLAIYQGIPLTQKSAFRAWDWPHKITIYRGPIRRLYGADPKQLEQEVAHIVRHELAHYFGISDARLIELGRY